MVKNRYVRGGWWDGEALPLHHILLSKNGALQGSAGCQFMDLESL